MAQPLKAFAKKLVDLSLDADRQPSQAQVAAVLEALRQDPPRQHRRLLRLYAKFLEAEERRGQAKIEYAGAIGAGELTALEEKFTRDYGRKNTAIAHEKPQLIAGVRVTVGDDVYDSSLATRLAQLEHNLA